MFYELTKFTKPDPPNSTSLDRLNIIKALRPERYKLKICISLEYLNPDNLLVRRLGNETKTYYFISEPHIFIVYDNELFSLNNNEYLKLTRYDENNEDVYDVLRSAAQRFRAEKALTNKPYMPQISKDAKDNFNVFTSNGENKLQLAKMYNPNYTIGKIEFLSNNEWIQLDRSNMLIHEIHLFLQQLFLPLPNNCYIRLSPFCKTSSFQYKYYYIKNYTALPCFTSSENITTDTTITPYDINNLSVSFSE